MQHDTTPSSYGKIQVPLKSVLLPEPKTLNPKIQVPLGGSSYYTITTGNHSSFSLRKSKLNLWPCDSTSLSPSPEPLSDPCTMGLKAARILCECTLHLTILKQQQRNTGDVRENRICHQKSAAPGHQPPVNAAHELSGNLDSRIKTRSF